MFEWMSNLMLAWAFVAVTALLVLYGCLQAWWKSWFGIAMILALTSLWQVLARSLATLHFGEEYAGREWVLLFARGEMALGLSIVTLGLGREVVRSWRAAGRTETAPHEPARVTGDL